MSFEMSDTEASSVVSEEGVYLNSSNAHSEEYNPNEYQYDPTSPVQRKAGGASSSSSKGRSASPRDLTRMSIGSKGSNKNEYDDDFDDLTDENRSQRNSPKNANNRQQQSNSSSGSVPKKAFIGSGGAVGVVSSNSATYLRQYNPHLANQHLPSLQAQSIQAELALDDISREVIRLRNQQRAVLKERRVVAKEKKQRADERRQQYNDQIVHLSGSAKEAEALLYTEKNRVSLLEKELAGSKVKLGLLEDSLERYSKQIESLNSYLADKDAAIARLNEENASVSNKIYANIGAFEEERRALVDSAQRSEALAGVLRGQMEEGERRLQADRDNIPAYQKQYLDTETEKIRRAEERLRLREESVRAEYESGMRGIEALRASCLDEHNKMRARYEDDLHQARLEVEKRRQSMDNEREVLALRKLSDSNEIESARVQVALKEKHLVELQASIGRSKVELEVAQKLIEPGVRAAEAEREEARRIRAQADNVMRAAEEHASAVLLAEQGLLKREKECSVAMNAVNVMKNNMLLERRNLHIETSKLNLQFQHVMNEKSKLHKVLLDINCQNDNIRKTIGLLPFAVMGSTTLAIEHADTGKLELGSRFRSTLDSLDRTGGGADRSLVAFDSSVLSGGGQQQENNNNNSNVSISKMVNANNKLLGMKDSDPRRIDHQVVRSIDAMTTDVHRNVDRDINAVMNPDFGSSSPFAGGGSFSLGSTLSSLNALGSSTDIVLGASSRQATSDAVGLQNILNNLSSVAAGGRDDYAVSAGEGDSHGGIYGSSAKVGLGCESLHPGTNYSLSIDSFREASDSLLRVAAKYA